MLRHDQGCWHCLRWKAHPTTPHRGTTFGSLDILACLWTVPLQLERRWSKQVKVYLWNWYQTYWGIELLLDLGVEIDARKVLQLFGVSALPLEGVFFVCVLIRISIDQVNVEETQRIKVMFDTVADEDWLAAYRLKVFPDRSESWCIGKPLPSNSVDLVKAPRDRLFRAD